MNCASASWPLVLARSAGVLKPCDAMSGEGEVGRAGKRHEIFTRGVPAVALEMALEEPLS